jgi:hypothetical protein
MPIQTPSGDTDTAAHNGTRAHGIEYSRGAPIALGDLQRAQFPQERRSRVESGSLAQIRTSNCTEGHSPYGTFGRPCCRWWRRSAPADQTLSPKHRTCGCARIERSEPDRDQHMEVPETETNELCRVRSIDPRRRDPNTKGVDAPLGWTHPPLVVDPRVRPLVLTGNCQPLLKRRIHTPAHIGTYECSIDVSCCRMCVRLPPCAVHT